LDKDETMDENGLQQQLRVISTVVVDLRSIGWMLDVVPVITQ